MSVGAVKLNGERVGAWWCLCGLFKFTLGLIWISWGYQSQSGPVVGALAVNNPLDLH